MLRELSAAQATGELICATAELEAHIYLQQGRVAWATSSASRYAFGRDLIRRVGIDQNEFREVVESCRRERRPLGETLVEWGLTTTDEVRASLEAQIREVMGALTSLRDAQTMFLERGEGFRTYATELTFPLEELVDEPVVDERAQELLERTLEALPEARWIEVVHHGASVLEHSASGDSPTTSATSLAELAFGDGVRMMTIRSGLGTVVGFTNEESDHRVIIGLGSDSRLGTISAALARFTPEPLRKRPPTTDRSPVAVGEECEPCADSLWNLVRRSDDIAVASMHQRDGRSFTVHRAPAVADHAASIAARGQPILHSKDLDDLPIDPRDTQVEMLGFHFRSVVLGTAEHWHFGGMIPDSSGRTIWLTIPRAVSQGLGWALLTATNRHLAEVPCQLAENG